MWLTGSERLAEAEPGFAELAAAVDTLLIDGPQNVFDPGDVAVILDKPEDDVRRLFERATASEVDLLVGVEMVECPRCEGLTPNARLRREIEDTGESTCSRCGEPLDLASARTRVKYRLSESAEAEVRALDQRPKQRALALTAIAVEHAAVLRHLADTHEVVDGGTVYQEGRFASTKTIWSVTAAQIGAGTSMAAAGTMKALLDRPADVIVFVGIAGGLKEDVELGDVVAAEKVHGYEPGKAADEFIPRPDQARSAYRLIQRAHEVARLGTWTARILDPPDPLPKAIVAEIASGDNLVVSTSSALYQLLRARFDRCVAVEMEGIGFFIANYVGAKEALVVRGISDMVERKAATDREGWQQRAADHAAAFTFELLATL